MSFGHLFGGLGFKWGSSSDGVKQSGPERVDIAANILWLSQESLGGNVVGGTPNLVLLTLGGSSTRRQTKIG